MWASEWAKDDQIALVGMPQLLEYALKERAIAVSWGKQNQKLKILRMEKSKAVMGSLA